MKRFLTIKTIGLLFISLMMAACVKYDDIEPFDGKVLPRRSGYMTGETNDWIYFNLRTGEIFNRDKVNADISEGEQYNRTDWDLAFCGYVLRTNSGTSGIGKGGAADLGKGNYSHWTSVSQLPKNLKWITDTPDVEVTYSARDWNRYLIKNHLDFDSHPWFDPNSGPQRTTTNANPVLSQAIRFMGPPPTYTPSMHTYVVRTADGAHFFKLQIVSWYDPETEIGGEGGRISYYCSELK